ncbi:glycoside hydrolase family 1 protein [Gilliamella apicola]|uniref:glycoside hydrolase family 1 protein n=1 Tax=Gilliamella apicola TaxID=1196095 RepID=UPI0009FF2EED|nr:glycoside hydrolase family 1 protein [Gilliamella apicola]ORF46829.1 6-phospho-beta-glucosidase [Gilliamella apicola]ORF49744.1 6-phospho-beta-glucosidase [Gilliamella apicola]ORF54941.1 6-phospho-beta-glucosidase [Gilliamella apicola]ORF54984.1 6-phospho-beta-glucosidase [Gilliamella apicola]ORF57125.1 6-phospho-beta-glucosidase [Gilliamella apicola]
MKAFAKDFWWGASSSAFQIEGGWDADGKGMTVADYNSFQRSAIQADSKVASDFYHHVESDIALFKELGLKTYRFSLSWARIIPDGDGEINQAGIDFYNRVINELIKNDIIPFITLYHFDLPFALVDKYNGWQDRRCVDAFRRYAQICYKAFGDRVKHWQINNEQNLMIRVNERMNMYQVAPEDIEKVRAQMDYHMFVAHAMATNDCHALISDSKVGPAVSSTMTYPASNKPMDVWAAKMNDNFKTNYALEMYCFGDYPNYYKSYLTRCGIYPNTHPEDAEILKQAKPDFIAVNYYRTLVASYLPEDDAHPFGTKEKDIDFDLYGYFKIEKNPNLVASTYGAQIDPMGLRLVLNEYYRQYRLPLIITENGLGTPDTLTADNKVHDDYRIDYIKSHISACHDAIEDGVELFGYCPWSVIDLLSSHQGFKKRYGFVYIDRDDHDLKTLNRIKKDSFYWYQQVIKDNGIKE